MATTNNNTPNIDVQVLQLEKTLAAAREEQDASALMVALVEYGQFLFSEGDAPKALTHFEEAFDIVEDLDRPEELARLWGLKGKAFKGIGNFDMAMAAFRKSNRIAREIENKVLISDSLAQIGMLQAEDGEISKAISKVEQALALAVEMGDDKRRLSLNDTLASYFVQLQSNEKATEYYYDGFSTAERMGNVEAQSGFLVKLARVSLMEEEYETANEHFERALDMATSNSLDGVQLMALDGLMRANLGLEKHALISLYGDQVIRLASERGNPLMAVQSISTLISAFLDQGQPEKGEKYIDQGLEISEQQKNNDWKLDFLMFRAYALQASENLPESLSAYNEALKLAVRIQDKASEARIQMRRSSILAEQELITESVQAAQRAVELAEKSEDIQFAGETHLALAFALQDNGDVKAAKTSAEQALASFVESQSEALQAHAQSFLDQLEE